MEQARPHYRNCWPSLVHAAALWLSNGGYDMTVNEPAVSNAGKNAYKPNIGIKGRDISILVIGYIF